VSPDIAAHNLFWLAMPFAIAGCVGGLAGWGLDLAGLRWTWPLVATPAAFIAWMIDRPSGALVAIAIAAAAGSGLYAHQKAIEAGGDLAQKARAKRGPWHALQAIRASAPLRRGSYLSPSGLVIGRGQHGQPVRIPFTAVTGSHCLVVGATGSGKTVTQAWIASRAIKHGFGAVVIDPKGDQMLHHHLRHATRAAGRRFVAWTPMGSVSYNPYAQGSDTEIADKALAGETYTEPHYQRQAQRFLGHTVRALRAAGITISPASLSAHLDVGELDLLARQLPDDQARALQRYLRGLSPQQVRELAGMRDRLAILAESDLGSRLEPGPNRHTLDLRQAIGRRDVVVFSLEADRRPLAAQMLAAAIVSDLLTIAADRQTQPQRPPALVVIDEFSAVAPHHIARLFGRARSAAMTILLGTQEIADLRAADHTGALADQVIGNVASVIAHRQTVPDSAELIAGIAGTHGAWIHTTQTHRHLTAADATPAGTRTRGREYHLHPDTIKHLPTGTAAVITPARQPPVQLAHILNPATT
jgi:type IV secretory pathway TraG/TraD family ATPase VirD4